MRGVEDDTKTEDAIPYWKIDDFLGFPGFSWVWVVLRAARAKKVETKRFYLQRSAPIQPKTSEILPKNCNYLTFCSFAESEVNCRVARSGFANSEDGGAPAVALPGRQPSTAKKHCLFFLTRARVEEAVKRTTCIFSLLRTCGCEALVGTPGSLRTL